MKNQNSCAVTRGLAIMALIGVIFLILFSIFGEGVIEQTGLEGCIRTCAIPVAAVLFVGILLWAFIPRKPKNGGTGKAAELMIACGLSYWLIVFVGQHPLYAGEVANYSSGVSAEIPVPQRITMTIDEASKMVVLQESIRRSQESGQKVVVAERAVPGCDVKIVLFLVVTGILVVITIEVVKACDKISKKRKKQIEDEDGEGSTNQQRIVSFALREYPADSTNFAACFFAGYELPTALDDADPDVQLPFRFSWPSLSDGSPRLILEPPKNLVDYDLWLINHGLSTNDVDSFSFNGVPCGPSPLVTYDSLTKIVSINLPDRTNVLNWVQYSTDNVSWETVVRLSAPAGATIKFGNAYSPISSQGSWRVGQEH